MKNITFKNQMYMGLAVALLCFVLSAVFKQGIFANIGWVCYGALFVLNPVCPERSSQIPNIKTYIRLTGVLVIFLGIIIRFGV